MTVLDTIIEHKQAEVAARKVTRPLDSLMFVHNPFGRTRDFRGALVDPVRPAPRVIAEIKRRSPSKGDLRPDLDPAQIAQIYEQNGAAAISVLTDNRFFGGSLVDLSDARRSVSLPVLCKEFIIDPYQIYEARLAGADAVLLIAAVLTRDQLSLCKGLSASLGMAALVEVHNETELSIALDAGADIIGFNNRNLGTFTVNLHTTYRLMPLVPPGIIVVSESGIRTRADRDALAALGVDALLVGESLVTADDIEVATQEICGLHPAALGRRG